MSHMPWAAYLMANDGQGGEGEVLDLTPFVTEAGSISYEVDKELTRISPGTMAVRVADPKGEIWAWLEARALNEKGALPPWFFYDVGEHRRFFGLVAFSQVNRMRAESQPSIEISDWSAMLSNIVLDWERPWPMSATEIPPRETKTCKINPRRVTRFIGDHWEMDDGFRMEGPDFAGVPYPWISEGMLANVRLKGPSSPAKSIDKNFKVLRVNGSTAHVNGLACAVGDCYSRHAPHPGEVQVTKLGGFGEPIYVFTARFKVNSEGGKKRYTIPLDTVDGLVQGDKLEKLSLNKKDVYTVLQIDIYNNAVITKEEVGIEEGDKFYLSEESREEMAFEDARALICRACAPFKVNLERFYPAVLPGPAFAWLPLRPLEGHDVLPVSDMESTGDKIKVYSGFDRQWVGSPTMGWEASTEAQRYADWAAQRTDRPAALMPLEEPEGGWPRGVAEYTDFKGVSKSHKYAEYKNKIEYQKWLEENLFDPWEGWTADGPNEPPELLAYDYGAMCRYRVPEKEIVVMAEGWTGGGWAPKGSILWPTPAKPYSICPIPGAPHFVVGLNSTGITIASTSSHPGNSAPPGGTVLSASVAAFHIALPESSRLATTPWGVYVITPTGYGRIVPIFEYRSAFGMAIASIQYMGAEITNDKNARLIPSSFVGMGGDSCAVFGQFYAADSLDDDRPALETHLLFLRAWPRPEGIAPNIVNGEEFPASVLLHDKVLDGRPMTIGCTRDPSKLNRVVGHLGGAMFQIDSESPWTIERFAPGDMNAMELIEHVCQIQMATAWPTPEGEMHIVSRNLCEKPIHLDLPRSIVQTDEALDWEERASVVTVTGQNGSAAEAVGLPGAGTVSIENHPMIHSNSMAKAMAQAWLQYYGEPRKAREMTLAWLDTSRPAPWQGLGPLPTIQINDEQSLWIIMGIDHDEASGECRMKLLESPGPAYGQDYGMGGV